MVLVVIVVALVGIIEGLAPLTGADAEWSLHGHDSYHRTTVHKYYREDERAADPCGGIERELWHADAA